MIYLSTYTMLLSFLMFLLFVHIIQLFYRQVGFISKGLVGRCLRLIITFVHTMIYLKNC
jgi:hypothetical protein